MWQILVLFCRVFANDQNINQLTKNEFLIFKNKNSLKQKKEFLGGRFAAKEAFFKAHGIEHGMLSFHDIEILNDKNGKPKIKLS